MGRENRESLDQGKESESLVIRLEGWIDSHNVEKIKQDVSVQCRQTPHKRVVFDARELTYISSAGLRFLVQIVKNEQEKDNERVAVVDVSRDVYDIFEMTGFLGFMDVQRAFREMSVEGCRVIGQGFWGTVYQIDPDTIVKVYSGKESLPMIKNEQAKAKKALLRGIPTAISYDIVKVGNDYGSVFELLDAKSINDMVIKHEMRKDKLEDLMRTYVRCIKQVHSTEMGEGELPFARDMFISYLEKLRDILSQEMLGKLKDLLEGLPDDLHAVHGDFQMKNVMFCNGEPMLIDMETLSVGQPIFDLQGLYVTYKAFSEDEPSNTEDFLGIRKETADYIWQRFMELYFETEDQNELRRMEDKIRIVASIRFLFLLVSTSMKDNEYAEVRIKHTREHLVELLDRVESLWMEQ